MYPQNRGVIAVGPYYLTYNNLKLSVWDVNGTRVKTVTLNGAGTSFDSYFSLSWANKMVFIVDKAGGLWRGFAPECRREIDTRGAQPWRGAEQQTGGDRDH